MSYRRTRVLISLGAVIALIAYLFAPEILGGTLSSRVDNTALLLLALAALPWLALLVSEFEAFGMKAKMHEVDKKADEATDIAKEARDAALEARTAAAEANAAADLASEAATEARAVAEDRETAPVGVTDVMGDPFTLDVGTQPQPAQAVDQLLGLAKDYVRIRKTHASGPDRTSMMTSIFTQMQNAARELGPARDDVAGWLSEPDAGKQLAAIAYVRVYPDTVRPGQLVAAIGDTGEPFVQYWALRALSGRVDSVGIEGFSIADRDRLKRYEASIKRGTDRHTQLTRLNHRLDKLA